MSINEQLRSMMPTNKTARELAEHFGVSPESMNDWLVNAGLKSGVHYAPMFCGWGVDWANVDWSLRNVDLAKQLHRDQRYIANMRRKHAPPELKSSRRLTRLKN